MLNTSEQFVADYFNDPFDPFEPLQLAIQDVAHFISQTHRYASKQERIDEWAATDPCIEDLVISIFTTTILNHKLTYQAVCGMLNHKIKLPDLIDRIKTVAEVVAVISKTGLIHVMRKGQGENTVVMAGYSIEERIPTDDRHALNKYKAQDVVENYDDIQGSMLLGGCLNHHEEDICLNHINKMNAIPLRLNIDFLKKFEELPTFDLDTPEKKEQWNKYRNDSIIKYVDVAKRSDNKFYADHKWCTRGRCYDLGYHISTQGTSFKKAIVQFHKQELVTDKL